MFCAESLLSLDVVFLFGGGGEGWLFQRPPVSDCSTASCNFGAITGEMSARPSTLPS